MATSFENETKFSSSDEYYLITSFLVNEKGFCLYFYSDISIVRVNNISRKSNSFSPNIYANLFRK